jgi:hypothetical protein
MQRARNLRTDAPRRAGHKRRLAGQWQRIGHGYSL